MEFHFESVYKEALILDVQSILTHPQFSTKKSSEIYKIVRLVQKKTSNSKDLFQKTEREALKLTIQKHIKLDELFEFFKENDSDLLEYYKNTAVPFSNGRTIDLSDYSNSDLPSKIADRIYDTRNSLVHNKSDETREEGFVVYHPFSDEKALIMEIPLMKILAETILINTSTQLS